MAYLLDTNILGRLAITADAAHGLAAGAILELHRRGETLYVTPQILVEFRNMATRPASVNGLGLTATHAEKIAAAYESSFRLLPETPDIFPAWKALVEDLGVIGKQVHDARLVAVCHVHGVTHLLTFNGGHFARMGGHGPGVLIIDPASV